MRLQVFLNYRHHLICLPLTYFGTFNLGTDPLFSGFPSKPTKSPFRGISTESSCGGGLSLKPYSHGISIIWWSYSRRLSVISVMSVICKVTILLQMTSYISPRPCDNISPVRIGISVIWPAFGGSYILFQGFCFFCTVLSIFRDECSCVGVFDSILGHITTPYNLQKEKAEGFEVNVLQINQA